MLNDYVVIDLEMTGLQVKTEKILEVGAVKVRQGIVTETFSKLINPKRQLSEKIVELTGITNEMAQQGMDLDETMETFLMFLGDDIVVGQNIMFDYSFLKQWAVNHDICLECKGVDTLKLARRFLPKEQKKDLESLCSYFSVPREHAHRALEDALETQKILECLKTSFGKKEPDAFLPKPLLYKVKKQTLATKQQMAYLQKVVNFHQIPMPSLPEDITRAEVSRLTDRLLLQYGKIR